MKRSTKIILAESTWLALLAAILIRKRRACRKCTECINRYTCSKNSIPEIIRANEMTLPEIPEEWHPEWIYTRNQTPDDKTPDTYLVSEIDSSAYGNNKSVYYSVFDGTRFDDEDLHRHVYAWCRLPYIPNTMPCKEFKYFRKPDETCHGPRLWKNNKTGAYILDPNWDADDCGFVTPDGHISFDSEIVGYLPVPEPAPFL